MNSLKLRKSFLSLAYPQSLSSYQFHMHHFYSVAIAMTDYGSNNFTFENDNEREYQWNKVMRKEITFMDN